MSGNLTLRRGKAADSDFIVEAIIEAEKSGTNILSYCRIFALTEAELKSLFRKILEEDFEGQELCISGFLVAEVDGELAGAACAWVEGASGMASTIIKGNLLQHFMEHDRLQTARPWFSLLEGLSIQRENGAIQLESIYVRQAFRGQGITGKILSKHMSTLQEEHPGIVKAQIILAGTNQRAYRSYEKLGFEIREKRHVEDQKILEIVPCDTKILLEKMLI